MLDELLTLHVLALPGWCPSLDVPVYYWFGKQHLLKFGVRFMSGSGRDPRMHHRLWQWWGGRLRSGIVPSYLLDQFNLYMLRWLHVIVT